MRARALVRVLLFIFFVVSAAAAVSDGRQSSASASSQKYDLFQCSTPTSICNQMQAPNERQQIRIRKLPPWQFHGLLPQGGTVPGPLLKNPVDCYTMRTYTVAREDNTDSTRPTGYTTCVPGSKVQVKNATPNR